MAEINDGLNHLLADYQVLYQKLRNYHWNVSGPLFFNLHLKFEELYNDAALKVDELAERILALNGKPVSTLKQQLEISRIKEDEGTPAAEAMVANIRGDLETLNRSLRELSGQAGETQDLATANLLDGFADEQEKTLWMLRAFLSS